MTTKLLLPLALALFFGNIPISHQVSFKVEGIVKDKQTGEPVRYVHVFTVKGEEEAVTNEKGEFGFETWRQVAELTTEKEGYRQSVTKLSLPAPKQTILVLKESKP